MANFHHIFIALISSLLAFNQNVSHANFLKSTVFNWGAQHSSISANGEDLQLVLDRVSGSGIQSKKKFLFGSIEMLIKLVPGNSAGTVTAYYVSLRFRSRIGGELINPDQLKSISIIMQLSSTGSRHDEIDFEFLGNVSGQPYIVHTNVYTQGIGTREQQFYLWFDPTADFHNYTIHWNPSQIVWFIDGLPIRTFPNYESRGIPYPNKQAMKIYSSIWNADNWATRGGLEKIDWSSAPFIARLRQLRLRACKWNGPASTTQCSSISTANWWSSPTYSKLSFSQLGQMKWVRDNYIIYDYCKDTLRFNGQIPPECSQQLF